MITLGLDASTSTIGWAFAENGVILECGFFDTKKLESNKEKATEFISFIKKNKNLNNTESMVLEGPLMSFSHGFTSQQTIIKLVKWNAIFEYILTEEFPDIKIYVVGVNTIRKNVFGKCRVKGVSSKDFVVLKLNELYPDLEKYNVYNKRNNVDKRMGDVYDAIVCSLYNSTNE